MLPTDRDQPAVFDYMPDFRVPQFCRGRRDTVPDFVIAEFARK